MHKIRSAAMATAIATLLMSSSAMAQVSSANKTKGLMIGAHVNGSSVKFGQIKENASDASTSSEAENGGGGGVQVGWGFTKWLTVYGGFDIAKMKIKELEDLEDADFTLLPGDYNLTHADIGARFSLPTEKMVVPYVNAALSARVVSAEILDEDISLSGPAFTFGAGVQFFFNPKLALDVNLQLSAGKFTEAEAAGVKVDLDKFAEVENTNSARINIGLKFYPHFGGK